MSLVWGRVLVLLQLFCNIPFFGVCWAFCFAFFEFLGHIGYDDDDDDHDYEDEKLGQMIPHLLICELGDLLITWVSCVARNVGYDEDPSHLSTYLFVIRRKVWTWRGLT